MTDYVSIELGKGLGRLLSSDRVLVAVRMGDYDYKPSGSLKLKGVKDKKIKKKKEKSEKRPVEKKEASPDKAEEKPQEPFVVHKTEAERRFEEIQRQRVIASSDVC